MTLGAIIETIQLKGSCKTKLDVFQKHQLEKLGYKCHLMKFSNFVWNMEWLIFKPKPLTFPKNTHPTPPQSLT